MQEFITAAREDFQPDTGKEHTILLDGHEIVLNEPNTSQAALMVTFVRGGEMTAQRMSEFMALFFSLVPLEEDQVHLQDRLLDVRDPFKLDSEGGLLDIFYWLMEQIEGGRPPVAPSDYQPSRRATGQRSTATTRAKASTSSPSRSRASSRSSKSGTSNA